MYQGASLYVANPQIPRPEAEIPICRIRAVRLSGAESGRRAHISLATGHDVLDCVRVQLLPPFLVSEGSCFWPKMVSSGLVASGPRRARSAAASVAVLRQVS